MGCDNFSARWTGYIFIPTSGGYTFTLGSDDGSRLWVNNQRLIDQWRLQSYTESSHSISLSAGWYPIRVEYYEAGGDARVSLFWSGPFFGKQLIAPQNLLACGAFVLGRVATAGGETIVRGTARCNFTPYFKDGSCTGGNCPGASCVGGNLVRNGSFEEGTSGWAGSNVDWGAVENGIFGNRRLRIRRQNANDAYVLTNPWIDHGSNLAGRTFTLSFSARSASGNHTFSRVGLQSYPTGGNWANSRYLNVGNITVTPDWQRFIFSLTFPTDINESNFRVVLRPSNTIGVDIYYDGISVETGITQGLFSDNLKVVCLGSRSGATPVTATWGCNWCGAFYGTERMFSRGEYVACTLSNLPAGYTCADPANCIRAGNLSMTQDDNHWWFYISPPGAISGTIWLDNEVVNGSCHSPPPSSASAYTASPITVRYSPCRDGDPNWPSCQTQTSTRDGRYTFNNVPAGTYSVSISSSSLPPGYYSTTGIICPSVTVPSRGTAYANFGIAVLSPWIQGTDASIYGLGINVRVPPSDPGTVPPFERWLLPVTDGYGSSAGGVVISGNNSLTCGGDGRGRCSERPLGDATEPGWTARNSPIPWPSFGDLTRFESFSLPPWNNLNPNTAYRPSGTVVSPPSGYNLSASGVSVVYIRDSVLHFRGNFVSSDTDREGIIFVADNTPVLIDAGVTRIDAVIIAIRGRTDGSGVITVGGSPGNSNLTVNGMLYAQRRIANNRSLDNNQSPAVVTRYLPFYLSQPSPLMRPAIYWREVAP